MTVETDKDLAEILTGLRSVAMIGASHKPERPSYGVMRFLQRRGVRVIPVNPAIAGRIVNDEPVVASLMDITEAVDMVDIFRRPEQAADAVDDAIAAKDRLGISTVWMQLGVTNDVAADRAAAAGLRVVMDRCPAIEVPRLGL